VLKAVAKAEKSNEEWNVLRKRHSVMAYSDLDSGAEKKQAAVVDSVDQ